MIDKLAIAQRRAEVAEAKVRALVAAVAARPSAGMVYALALAQARLTRAEAAIAAIASEGTGRGPAVPTKAATPRIYTSRGIAPAVDARWKIERLAEDKRVAKRKAELASRHVASQVSDEAAPISFAQRVAWLAPSVRQPATVEQEFTPTQRVPWLSLLDENPLPREWTARHVGVRMIDAHRVMRSIPGRIGPKIYGAAWPAYRPEAGDVIGEADGTYRTKPTAYEIARADEAIMWPLQYLSNHGSAVLASLNWWAAKAADPDDNNPPDDLLRVIAESLNAAKEPVR